MRDSACRCFIEKTLKYFEVMLNIFEFPRVGENLEPWLVYANKLFWIAQPDIFLDQHNKTNLVQASFFCFLDF